MRPRRNAAVLTAPVRAVLEQWSRTRSGRHDVTFRADHAGGARKSRPADQRRMPAEASRARRESRLVDVAARGMLDCPLHELSSSRMNA